MDIPCLVCGKMTSIYIGILISGSQRIFCRDCWQVIANYLADITLQSDLEKMRRRMNGEWI